jgi:hypothetical protein
MIVLGRRTHLCGLAKGERAEPRTRQRHGYVRERIPSGTTVPHRDRAVHEQHVFHGFLEGRSRPADCNSRGMVTRTGTNRPRVEALGQSIAIIAAAVAVCLLLTAVVLALVPPESAPREDEVTAESLPSRPPASPAPPLESMAAQGAPMEPVTTTEPAQAIAPSPPDAGIPDAALPPDAAPTDATPTDASPVEAGPVDASTLEFADAALADADAGEPQGVPCGTTLCPPDKVCCNASCGTCANPGELCDQLVCGMSVAPVSAPCGRNTCNVGERCCNPSCGICVGPGEPCDERRRCSGEIEYPQSHVCGMQTCNVGFVCCNPSCGVCKRPGEPCSQEPCG